ncbi:cytochrome b [Kangiella sp. TOML190]|uniref:cytochrome b n=1 Tax=Kangiella sp. TOML190 TaxID=2931351 RepID=UPI00203AC3A6|nr:cytochrome b [Kangiella sp. TOML190]
MTEKYSLTMRILHWFMALLVLGLICTGWYMEGIPRDAPDKFALYPWHKSFGLTLFLLLIVRLLVRFTSNKPTLPQALPAWEKTLSKVGHFLLYALMLMVPLSGIIMSDMGGGGKLNFFFTTFDILESNKEVAGKARGAHGVLPYVLLGIVVLHILGALKHRFIDKDPEVDVLKRML